MAANPLEERKLSFDEAKSLGYILPVEVSWSRAAPYTSYENYIKSQVGSEPKGESYYESMFNQQIEDAQSWTSSTANITFYPNQYTTAKQALQLAPTYINKRTEAVKAESGRTFGRTKAIEQRIARATGGLLASSAAPSLSEQGKGGLPDLSSTGPSFGVTQQLGTKAKR